MNRRGFLGSVIGTLVSVPFFARLRSEPWQSVIHPGYRMLIKVKDKDGQEYNIQAPGVKKITCPHPGNFTFESEELVVENKGLCYKGVILTTDKGHILSDLYFPSSVYLDNPGDKLIVYQTIGSGGNKGLLADVTVEELTEILVKYGKHRNMSIL